MMSRKPNSNGREETNDDIFIEEFAREFFETGQSNDELSKHEKTAEVKRKDYKKEKRKYGETYSPKLRDTDREKRESTAKVENSQRDALKKNSRVSPHTAHTGDSRQLLMKRFFELRNEFRSLSDRLHDASAPNVSKKLTKVLAERQRLVQLLLDVGAPSSSDLRPGHEEERFHEQARPTNGVSKQEIGIPRKTKSVHWSDEHLGGSIILDPSVYADQRSNSTSTHIQIPERRHKSGTKPPPSYKMVDNQTQTRRSHEKEGYDLDRCGCDVRIDDEMEYVKEILNEAAELRREACCMIWRAHYLEQLCDADGLVKHVYRSASNVPTLPRYSHLYR